MEKSEAPDSENVASSTITGACSTKNALRFFFILFYGCWNDLCFIGLGNKNLSFKLGLNREHSFWCFVQSSSCHVCGGCKLWLHFLLYITIFIRLMMRNLHQDYHFVITNWDDLAHNHWYPFNFLKLWISENSKDPVLYSGVPCVWMDRMNYKLGPTILSLTVVWREIDAHEYFACYTILSWRVWKIILTNFWFWPGVITPHFSSTLCNHSFLLYVTTSSSQFSLLCKRIDFTQSEFS